MLRDLSLPNLSKLLGRLSLTLHAPGTLPTVAAQQVSVPLPQLTPGTYTVSWRAVSDDGHVMPGTLHFTLGADHATDRPADHSAQH